MLKSALHITIGARTTLNVRRRNFKRSYAYAGVVTDVDRSQADALIFMRLTDVMAKVATMGGNSNMPDYVKEQHVIFRQSELRLKPSNNKTSAYSVPVEKLVVKQPRVKAVKAKDVKDVKETKNERAKENENKELQTVKMTLYEYRKMIRTMRLCADIEYSLKHGGLNECPDTLPSIM